jgi:tetratricopeptide (TPR) repeat protein
MKKTHGQPAPSNTITANKGQPNGTPTPYIISRRVDMLLIVGAVILCPVLLLPLAHLTSPHTVWLVVMTFGAVGHHFPSFLRTYGDRNIFETYRIRLIVAPILLFAVTLGFSINNLHGMLLVSFCWTIWHGMMQHFGFMRIYDSKVRATDPFTARLDWWISFSWFGLCLVLSPNQGGSLLHSLYESGIPIVPLEYISIVRTALITLTALVTLVYLVHAWIGKQPRSWMKLGLLAGTFAYVYLVRVITRDPFLSVALFELLHDIQYLAIVWAFNRRLVDKGSGNVLMRFLYKPSALSVAAYVGACLAYGAFAMVVYTKLESGLLKQVLEALLITSGLLHFYYDGFIWKLRQTSTQSGLGIEGRQGVASKPPIWRGLGHFAIIVILAAMLARFELKGKTADPLAKAQAIVRAVPDNPSALNNLGVLLLRQGQYMESVKALRKVISIQPDLKEARESLSDALTYLSAENAQAGRISDAIAYSREAVAVEPTSAERYNDLAVLLAQNGFYAEAESAFRNAIALNPDHKLARENLQQLYNMRSTK